MCAIIDHELAGFIRKGVRTTKKEVCHSQSQMSSNKKIKEYEIIKLRKLWILNEHTWFWVRHMVVRKIDIHWERKKMGVESKNFT